MSQTTAKLKNKVDRDDEEGNEGLRLEEENPEYPGMSALVLVQRDQRRGRFAVAGSRIPPGTLIAVGEPTVALLNPDRKALVEKHCLACLLPCEALHPCLTCSQVVFCSPSCREAAVFHRYKVSGKMFAILEMF